jgi:iron complex outermembrane receptor protein
MSCAALLFACGSLAAQQPTERDLANLDLEELAQVKVTAAGRKPESLGQVAASVYVLTREDIRRAGATSLPELLRRVPGLQVARLSSREWSISARGFSDPPDKFLVLVDGRTVYSPIFAGVFWDVQDVILEDIERIEVILGPGASVWGSNAVNGVINVITLSAQATRGGQAGVDVGTEDRLRARARYGVPVGSGALRVYGQYLDRDGAAAFGGGDARNDWAWGAAGARYDSRPGTRDVLSAQAQAYWASGQQLRVLPAPAPPYLAIDSGDVVASGAYARVRWTRRFTERSDLALQAYVDHSRRTEGDFWRDSRVNVADIDFQHRFQLGTRHDVVWGAGYRLVNDDNPATYTLSWLPERRTVHLGTAFAMDDIELGRERWYLTAGARLERSSYTDLQVQPTVRLRWSPTRTHTVWASVSRAVRAPSRLDMDIREVAGTRPTVPPITVIAQGVDSFVPEKLWAYELGYRGEPTRAVTLDASVYYHVYRDLRTLLPEAPDLATGIQRYTVRNGARGTTWGGTAAATWRVAPSWKLRASYTHLDMKTKLSAARPGEVIDAQDGLSPSNQVMLQSSWDVGRAVELDLYARWVDSLPAAGIPDYAQADARVAWRPTPALSLELIGQDLLAARHREFRSDVFVPELREIERRVLGRAVWRF